jgi:hypothetical protein
LKRLLQRPPAAQIARVFAPRGIRGPPSCFLSVMGLRRRLHRHLSPSLRGGRKLSFSAFPIIARSRLLIGWPVFSKATKSTRRLTADAITSIKPKRIYP